MATKLGLYNGALRALGETPLVSVSESRVARRVLDSVYDNDFINKVLENGQWNFAARASELTYEPSITPAFGYRKAFVKPGDFIRTMAISSSEYFDPPLLQYTDEIAYWFCELETLYVKYVSNDASYGGNLAAWPGSFTTYAEFYLAAAAAPSINGDKLGDVVKQRERALTEAQSKDAMAEPAKFQPTGTWAGARRGNGRGYGWIGFER